MPDRAIALILIATLLLTGCVKAELPQSAVALIATPEPLRLSGTLRSPSCLGGYNTVNAPVTIRDEQNTVIGTGTTKYTGDANFALFDKAADENDTAGQAMVLGTVLGLAEARPSSHPRLQAWYRARDDRDRKAERDAVIAIFGDLRGYCHVRFDAEVKRADFYQLTIGHRAGPSYRYDELAAKSWLVELTLD